MKKPYIFLAVIVVVVVAISALSIYKYNATPKGLTLKQAVSQRDTALVDLNIQKQLRANDEKAIANLTSDKQTLTTNQVTLCAQIKAAKLVQPLCK